MGTDETAAAPEPDKNTVVATEAKTRSFSVIDRNATGEQTSFASNVIKTTKYSVIPIFLDFFLWKMLFEQFQRKANLYFLCVGILQTIGDISPTGKWTTLATLCGVVMFSMIKSAYEDLGRYAKDKEENGRDVWVLDDASEEQWVQKKYTDIKVGDIVRVTNIADEYGDRRNDIPCDLVLLTSSDPEGIAYVETANLDGETNLKPRVSLDATRIASTVELDDVAAACAIKYRGASMETELPNNSLYTFSGNLTLPESDDSEGPLRITPDQMLYRGCLLRKVQWAVGICVFTGKETKIMMNARKPPHKASRVERMVNMLLLLVLAIQATLCVVCTLGLYFADSDVWYMGPSDSRNRSEETGLGFLTFIILFNNFIPISLYVSIELVKFFQGRLLEQDLAMYYDGKDMPATAKTTDLNEELGQIDSVFSDKTGTLTRNVMTFMKFSMPDGTVFGEGTTEIGRAAAKRFGREIIDKRPPEVIESDNPFWDERINHDRWQTSKEADEIRRLFTLLAVCHTVVVDAGKFEAESPDEEALVKAARNFGFKYVSRQNGAVIVELGDYDAPVEYQVLDMIAFNSDRKRMSVIIRDPDGRVKIMMKGADTTMFPRLQEGTDLTATDAALKQFGDEGLRTLVLAERELEPAEYEPWLKKNAEARALIGEEERKAQLFAEYGEEIEKDMVLVGTTAIEDKLQEGVPQTIEALRSAGMKVWMLTGDKMETAINIGFACALLHEKMKTLTLSTKMHTNELLEAIQCWTEEGNPEELDLGIIVDGDSLLRIFKDDTLKHAFVESATKCTSVVCCRVSPKQKADVVEMVRTDNPNATTLAIGDGANDVPMIQAAHVGVGISGMEGQQAANSADYAIGQFRYLHRLTLVHGRANYYRLCLLIRYFFYKNAAVVMTQFFYCIFNLFTGQSLYEQWTLAGYNVFFTSLPVIIIGVFERDVLNTDNIHDHPSLYKAGLNNELLNFRIFAGWIFNALFHAAVIFFVVMFGWGATMGREGVVVGLDGVGVTMYATVIVVVNIKLALHVTSFTWMHYLSFAVSVLGFFFFLAVYGAFPPTFVTIAYHQLQNIGFQLSPWIFFFVATALCMARDFLWRYAEYNFWPLKSLPLLIKIQWKDDQDPMAAVRQPIEVRRRNEIHVHMSDVTGGSSDMVNLFAEYDTEKVVIDPAQDMFMQFIDREIEDEFIDQHMGDLSRYKIGVGMCAIASLVIVLNFGASYDENSDTGTTELEIGTWTLFSFCAWLCWIILMCSGTAIKPHLHTMMTTLMLVAFSGMTIANLVRSDKEPDTHPVTLGVILLGLLTVVRPPVVHALHYIIIAFMCYVVWYQAFRVSAWGISDFLVRFVELVIVAVTSFTAMAVSESFLRRMFISQKQVQATSEAASLEEQRSLRLLGNVLPSAVVGELRANKSRQLSDFSVTYREASLLNSDIVKFTLFSSTKEPHVVVEMLNKMFTKFDANAKDLGLEKIKTIGDAYICAAGIPIPDPFHQRKILLMGLSMVKAIGELNAEGLTSLKELNIAIRIGSATGPVQAGVIGMQKVCYDVFGHVAEESEKMEQTGLPDKVQASPALYEATRDHFEFDVLEMDGVTRYFVKPIEERDDDLNSTTSTGNVLTNDLHREDIYKFLEDDDEDRREIIATYAGFAGDLGICDLNFKDGTVRTEEEFRLHLRTIANTRFTVEGSLGSFFFLATFVLILLHVEDAQTNPGLYIFFVLGLVHVIALIVRQCTKGSKDKQKKEHDKTEKKSAAGEAGDTSSEGTSKRRRSTATGMAVTHDDDSDVEDDESAVCTKFRVWAAVSGFLAYLMPLVLIFVVLWNDKGSSTIVVFVVLGANIYVNSFLHMRILFKIGMSIVHFIITIVCLYLLISSGSDRDLDSGKDGGDIFAIILCYVLSLIAAYTQEKSVRQSFAAAKRLVYQNAEVLSAIHLCDKLLNNVLPHSIVTRLKASPEKHIVDEVPEASAMFIYSEGMKPEAVEGGKSTGDIVAEMNEFLWLMDSLCVHHQVEKIKTTPFLIVSGCPEPVKDHARRLTLLARDIIAIADEYNTRHNSNIKVSAGIHTGKVTAGVLGSTKFLYDIFGDTVNFASRLTSSAAWGTVQMSDMTRKALGGEFDITSRGEIELKGKGVQTIYKLELHQGRIQSIPVPDFGRGKDELPLPENNASIHVGDTFTPTDKEGTAAAPQPLLGAPSDSPQKQTDESAAPSSTPPANADSTPAPDTVSDVDAPPGQLDE